MQAFANATPVEFQFTVVDVYATLYLPDEGAPFRMTRSLGVVCDIIPATYNNYFGPGPKFDALVLKFFDGHFLKIYVI